MFSVYISMYNKHRKILYVFIMYTSYSVSVGGSHNAGNICMSGSTSWGPEDDSLGVETCSS